MKKMELVYLACPYAHEDSTVVRLRFAVSTQMAADLIKKGVMVFAASMHNSYLHTLAGLSSAFTTWQEYNHLMIDRCDKVMVITMKGWEQSQGVQDQIAYAKRLNKPVEMISPSEHLVESMWGKICKGDTPLPSPL